LARFTGANAELEREVLELFLAEMPARLIHLHSPLSAKALRDTAHAIKGSARAIGAWRLARIAGTVEKAAEDEESGGATRCNTALRALAAAAEEVCRRIRGLYPSPTPSPTARP
jgi:HPt (histidine-containing phosphotransfer) domain-containing protein